MNEKRVVGKILSECPGWVDLPRALAVVELIRKFRLEYIVEIGVFGGRTLFPMAWAAKPHSGLVVGVDTFRCEDKSEICEAYGHLSFEVLHKQFIERISAYGLNANVRLIRKDAEHVSKKLPTEIDLLKLDGNLGSFASFHNARLYAKKVRKGGYLWLENMDSKEMAVVLKESKMKTIEVVRFDSHHAILERV